LTSVTLKSYRKQREKEIIDNLKRGMSRAVLIVENQAKKNVSKTGEEHPQVETGRGRASITSKVEGLEGTIGTNVYYMRIQELGSSRQPPYPWLFPAVEMKRDEIKDALKGKFTI